MNGDGFGDVLVGAHNYNNPTIREGRAYLFLGSSLGPEPTESWTAESDQAYGFFGISVASAGDVNGDGYGDVVIGSHYDNGEVDEGRAYLYLGSSSGLAASADWTAESNQTSAYLGNSVASAGDVNGDGYGDLIVGASSYDSGETNEGIALLYLGNGGDETGPAIGPLARARQPATSTPIAPGGNRPGRPSTSPRSYGLRLGAPGPSSRSKPSRWGPPSTGPISSPDRSGRTPASPGPRSRSRSPASTERLATTGGQGPRTTPPTPWRRGGLPGPTAASRGTPTERTSRQR